MDLVSLDCQDCKGQMLGMGSSCCRAAGSKSLPKAPSSPVLCHPQCGARPAPSVKLLVRETWDPWRNLGRNHSHRGVIARPTLFMSGPLSYPLARCAGWTRVPLHHTDARLQQRGLSTPTLLQVLVTRGSFQ